MKRYISLYLEVAPVTFAEMHRNLEKRDWEQLRIHAHSLKPQAEFMGIDKLKEELIKIEEAVNLNHLSEIENLLNTASTISTQSEDLLKEILAQF